MRSLDTTAWGNVAVAADAALDALRASAMAPAGAPAATVTPAAVSAIAVTDTNGRALPCKGMSASLATALATTTVTGAALTAVTDFQAKALERCNTDDDARADGFSAQALALLAI